MAITKYKPTSPGRRGMSTQDFASITKGKPEKSLLEHKPSRRPAATTTAASPSRFRGGGHKQRYRKIDFKRTKTGVPAKVLAIEYDPNRTARIALLQYADGEKAYILAPQKLEVGDQVSRPTRPTSSRATRCRSASSRSAPRSTPSSSRSAAAPSSAARPAPAWC
jgi:large subunit ribosomal protein L2